MNSYKKRSSPIRPALPVIKSTRPKPSSAAAPTFPRAWLWLVDEAIPNRVKQEYSPRDTWKDKPFSKEDARFFFKGIDELSTLFTEERPKGLPAYFSHPKYRSSYLLYFLPLQAAKFLTLFQSHPQAIQAALAHAKKSGVLKIADIGVGPGTASLSFLLKLLDEEISELPKVELYWFDIQEAVMADGKALVEQISSHFPKLRGKVQVHAYNLPWWKAHTQLPNDLSLTFIGHVLNESSAPQRHSELFWPELLKRVSGGGTLMVEPASRKSSQNLSHLRNSFFEEGLLEKNPRQIWGPCLHAETCPLSDGRDWCHFSVPLQIPGKWFKDFSKGLGSERQWVKYSYLWFASPDFLAPQAPPRLRRVISDPLSQGGPKSSVLICEPETPGRMAISAKDKIWRGDLVTLPEMTPGTKLGPSSGPGRLSR